MTLNFAQLAKSETFYTFVKLVGSTSTVLCRSVRVVTVPRIPSIERSTASFVSSQSVLKDSQMTERCKGAGYTT